MDFLTQEVFSPVRKKKEQRLYFLDRFTDIQGIYGFLMCACCQSYLPFGSSPTREVRKTRRPTPVKARVTLEERQAV